ncbi:unnamed protein product, partial [Arabidopsis halleri]
VLCIILGGRILVDVLPGKQISYIQGFWFVWDIVWFSLEIHEICLWFLSLTAMSKKKKTRTMSI